MIIGRYISKVFYFTNEVSFIKENANINNGRPACRQNTYFARFSGGIYSGKLCF
jgi:hypothetical protein